MGSLDLRLHRDWNAIGDAAKISPRVPSTCAQNGILSLLIIRDCKAMGNAAKISPLVPSTCAQNAILSLLIIHSIPSRQNDEGIDNLSLVPSVSCHTTSNYVWKISNNSIFRWKHPGVPDGSDGSGGTSYPLTENQTQRVALHTSLAADIIPCLEFLRHVALYIKLAAPASGFLFFTSGMW
jgi:hypothetical protein